MNQHRLSLYQWFVSALFFWVVLACWEVTANVVLRALPPPLGSRMLPSFNDLRYFIAAVTTYSFFGIATAIVLFCAERILAKWVNKVTATLRNINGIDMYLALGWGLLLFKWISNLLPYLTKSDHLPFVPYLLIIPFLGVQLWLAGTFRNKGNCQRVQWVMLIFGAAFLSTTAQRIFLGSDFSVFFRVGFLVPLVAIHLVYALGFYEMLKRILQHRLKPRYAYACSFIICLIGGLLVTFDALQVRSCVVASSRETGESQVTGGGAAQKNVIVLLVDCLRADHLGCYGYPKSTSSFIDHCAQSGVKFENCIAPSSWTIPSVVSLFTGVYPQQHGVNEPGTVIPENLVSIQSVLHEQKINTAAFITNDYIRDRWGYRRGFENYFDCYLEREFREDVAAGLFFLNALIYFKNEILYPYSVDPGSARWWSIGFPPFNHARISAERVTNDVLRWMELHGDRPFYLYVHYMDVHCPYDTLWYPLFDRAQYDAQDEKEKLINVYDGRITFVDRQIERIWDHLVKLRLSDKTLFVITADHGEELYDHGGIGHCTTLYDELIRVPLIMRNPSFIKDGSTIETQVELVELAPTVLDFFGLPVPAQMNGQSLLELIDGASLGEERRCALSYTSRGRKSLKTEEGRKLWDDRVWDQGIIVESLRVDNKWKIILGSDGRTELYNVKDDQGEQIALQDSEQIVAKQMQKELREKSDELQRFLPPPRDETELSPEMRQRLKGLGYL